MITHILKPLHQVHLDPFHINDLILLSKLTIMHYIYQLLACTKTHYTPCEHREFGSLVSVHVMTLSKSTSYIHNLP
jgi:hypothetical protein